MSKDTIYRQDAIDALDCINGVEEVLRSLPSAQPERLTDDDFETIRIHLNAYKEKLCNQQRWKEAEEYQRIIDRFMTFASAQTNLQQTCNELATDTISRQAAVDAIDKLSDEPIGYLEAAIDALVDLPSAQPEITEEQAIEHLQSTGWMQNHDREMYDMGLKKQLADDSGSYDSLLPSAQPEEDCDTCKHGYFGDDQCNNCRVQYPSHYERRTDENR